jgi:hypothetical protein
LLSFSLWVLKKKKKKGTVGVDGWGSWRLMGLPLFNFSEKRGWECEGQWGSEIFMGFKVFCLFVERENGGIWLVVSKWTEMPLYVFTYMGSFEPLSGWWWSIGVVHNWFLIKIMIFTRKKNIDIKETRK